MPFRQFRYIHEVMSCRSINQAAQNLYISPQALRSAINSLESRLGFQIFERSKQGVTLTPEGEQIRRDVAEIVRIGDHWDDISDDRAQGWGVVRLIASTAVCNAVIPTIMQECRKKYPDLHLQQYEARDDGLLAQLVKHRMIGVVGAAPQEVVFTDFARFAQENDYQLEILRQDCFYVYVNSANPLAEKEPLFLADLSGLTSAIYPGEDKRVAWRDIFRYFAPSPPLYLMHQENIFQLVAENLDIACIFPSIAGEHNRNVLSGKICPKQVTDFPMPALSCLFYPKGRGLSNGGKAVLDLIRTYMKGVKGVPAK